MLVATGPVAEAEFPALLEDTVERAAGAEECAAGGFEFGVGSAGMEFGDVSSFYNLRDAVDFVLINPDSHSPLPPTSSPSTLTPAPNSVESLAPADPSVATLVGAANKLVELVSSQQQPLPVTSPYDSQLPSSPRPASCSYCADPAHFIARCPTVTADIRSGLCRQNTEGKVVLPSGSFVPHRIVGPNLRARIASWHAANPARSTPPVASYNLAPAPFPSHVPVPQPRESPSATSHLPRSVPASASVSPFTAENRLAELQAQFDALRTRARSVAVPPNTEYSLSSPSQIVSHADFVSIYHQQQQNSVEIDTHEIPAPTFVPDASHRTPASQFAPVLNVEILPAATESSARRSTCRVAVVPLHTAATAIIPFRADSAFPRLYQPRSAVQRHFQRVESVPSAFSMLQSSPASSLPPQPSRFAPEISQFTHGDFEAPALSVRDFVVVPCDPAADTSSPSSPVDLISFD
ncbi:hypothetical protein C8R45DRAFT_1166470 [Mycena sanguinolenta]|nr:hypothetical protein C8R45DRAFT_1166470 [Mycena sanguinolenta]